MAGSAAFERLNFLYQASECVLVSLPQPAVALSQHYCLALKAIARRLVLRL